SHSVFCISWRSSSGFYTTDRPLPYLSIQTGKCARGLPFPSLRALPFRRSVPVTTGGFRACRVHSVPSLGKNVFSNGRLSCVRRPASAHILRCSFLLVGNFVSSPLTHSIRSCPKPRQ